MKKIGNLLSCCFLAARKRLLSASSLVSDYWWSRTEEKNNLELTKMSALDKYKTDWLIVRNQNSAHSYGEILEFKIQKLTRNFNSPRGGLSWERVDGNTVITRISAASSLQQDGACGFDWLLAVFNIMLYQTLKYILSYLLYKPWKYFLLRFFRGSYLLWSFTGIKGKRKAK